MSIDQPTVIDFIGTERVSGAVVLTVSDHLGWDDVRAHLQALQDKLNAYVDFVRSGRLLERYPAAAGRTVVIEIVHRYPLPRGAAAVLTAGRKTLAEHDIRLRFRRLGRE